MRDQLTLLGFVPSLLHSGSERTPGGTSTRKVRMLRVHRQSSVTAGERLHAVMYSLPVAISARSRFLLMKAAPMPAASVTAVRKGLLR